MPFRDRQPVDARGSIALLAALAYLPALLSSPGRMPADTKLYLYLDPGGLVGRAASTFEPDQFAGWVPHQQITYLWPSGPWFWLFDVAGVPDWIAHRLWIGTILFAAGAGMRLLAVTLRLPWRGALAAAVVYQLSPYLLAYVSRTSLLLLPWAALGWIVGLTVRATRVPADATPIRRWHEPAAIALIVATVGSTNATALALIAPAPVLWLVHVVVERRIGWRTAVGIALRTATLCVAMSLWWVAMLVVQARHGAPVLAYSETLTDVSRNATGPEVLRGLGYWLFYVRDAFAPTTSASLSYLVSSRAIAVSFAVTVVGLAGLAFGGWRERRFAAWSAIVGVVLAVGVHPIDSASPLMSLLNGDDGSGLALALRSSTRAVPLIVLAVALGTGALVARVPLAPPSFFAERGPTSRSLALAGAAGLALANLPALWQAELVDPAIDRDTDVPAAWVEAVDDLAADRARILQVPGAEFGAFDWGYTVDQPLVALTDRPLVTRDLLPLGSAAAMDLLYAFDDRLQSETLDADAVAPVSRLFAADVVWIANDLDWLRFRTPAPGVVDELLTTGGPTGLDDVVRYGTPAPATTRGPLVDAASLGASTDVDPIAPVAVVAVTEPEPIERVKTRVAIVSGSGDGIVDAAAVGLLDGHELIRYSGSLSADALDAALATVAEVIVTDSNRDRAHHWRSSQDVVGHTEPGGSGVDVAVPVAADQRLELFATADADRQTVALQRGPQTALASSYGEPFAYRPEDRAVHAIDGDRSTAWRVGDHGDPLGEFIRLVPAEPVERLVLHQVVPTPGGRRIATVDLAVDDEPATAVVLTDASISAAGQRVAVDAPPGSTIEIRITSVTAGDPAVAASRAGVGFVEIDLGLGSTTELVRPPVDVLERIAAASAADVALVLTRLRVASTDPWRSDPEPELQRLIPLGAALDVDGTATLRLDARAGDALVDSVVGRSGAIADRRLTGSLDHRGAAAVDGDVGTAWLTPIDDIVGATLDVMLSGEVDELVVVQPLGAYSTITGLEIRSAGASATVAVPPPDAAGRSTVRLPGVLRGDSLRLTITGIDPATAIERRYGDPITLPAGIAELGATAGIEAQPVDRAAVVQSDCTLEPVSIDGVPLAVRFEATVGELLDGDPVEATFCAASLRLEPGEHVIGSTARPAGLTVDRIVLQAAPPVAVEASPPADVTLLRDDPADRTARVTCPAGCWFVLGEGFNTAWRATAGGSLGSPQLVDGGFNGWWIPPGAESQVVDVRWTAGRPVTIGLVSSAIALLACLVLLVLGRRTAVERTEPDHGGPSGSPAAVARVGVGSAIALVVSAAALIGPLWAAVALGAVAVEHATGALARRSQRRWVERLGRLESLGTAIVAVGAVAVVFVERRDAPFPDAGWTAAFDHLHGVAVFAVLLVAVGCSRPAGRTSTADVVNDSASTRTGTDSRTAAAEA